MRRRSFVDDLMTYAISTLLTATKILFMYVLPPLFDLACGFTKWILLQAQAYVPLTRVHVILIATGGWAVAGLFLLPMAFIYGQTREQVVLIHLLIGGLVGLCIGGQVARDWVMLPPDHNTTDTPRQFGFNQAMFTKQTPPRKKVTLEDLFTGGVVLGEDLGNEHRRQ